jgi:hypothetical protein
MKKLSLKALNLSGAEVLTREQLKNVLGGGPFVQQTTIGGGGGGTYCAIYCCDNSGDCIFEADYSMTCSSSEECQSWAVNNGATCSGGDYVAALCKG